MRKIHIHFHIRFQFKKPKYIYYNYDTIVYIFFEMSHLAAGATHFTESTTRRNDDRDSRYRPSSLRESISRPDNKKLMIIGSYFVDLLYNNLYQKAKVDKLEYQDMMMGYISAIKADPKLIKRQVNDTYEYYKNYMRSDNLEYKDFIRDVCYELTTREMRKKMRHEQEQEFVADAFYKLLSALGSFLTTPDNIKNVIVEENRRGEIAKVFTESARERSVAILLEYRTKISNSFIEKATGVKPKTKASGDELAKFKEAIKKLIVENIGLKEKLERRDRRIRQLEDELEDLEGELGDKDGDDKPEDDERGNRPSKRNNDDRSADQSRTSDQQPRSQTQVSKPRVDASFFSDIAASHSESKHTSRSQETSRGPNFRLQSRMTEPPKDPAVEVKDFQSNVEREKLHQMDLNFPEILKRRTSQNRW